MISLKEAQELVLANAASFGTETQLLDDSVGRVLTEQIVADRDYPPFNRSAMDGYAIRFEDWKDGVTDFILVETIYAGRISEKNITKGECYKIMTGAAVPNAANVVIRKEDAIEENGRIRFNVSSIELNQSISLQGQDLKDKQLIYPEPTRINAADTMLLAAVGKYEVLVQKLPKVAIITTGDEVVSVEDAVNSVQIRNSNKHVLKALLKKYQIEPLMNVHIGDDKTKLESAIVNSLHADIIIINGGVSAGDADYVPDVLNQSGFNQLFHKVAIKPGKPIWFGKKINGPVVFALPGNPFSCMVTFTLFIEPFLCRCFGIPTTQPLHFPLKGVRHKNSSLDEFFPVKIIEVPSVLIPLHFNSSGDITAALAADGIAHHQAENLSLTDGDIVPCFLL